MPTPVYAFRLSRKTQDELAEMAKVYGAPNGRAFAREIIETVCSGDPQRMAAFNRRLLMGVGEQLALKLNAPLEVMAEQDRKERAAVDARPKGDARETRTTRKKRRKRVRRT